MKFRMEYGWKEEWTNRLNETSYSTVGIIITDGGPNHALRHLHIYCSSIRVVCKLADISKGSDIHRLAIDPNTHQQSNQEHEKKTFN